MPRISGTAGAPRMCMRLAGLECPVLPRPLIRLLPLHLPLPLAALLAAPELGRAAEPTLETITVQATAKPSGDGPVPYPGGQVAQAAQLGVLGTTAIMDAPLSVTSYTAQTLENEQSRSVAETLGRVAPAVRLEYGSGTSADALMVRGFALANDEIALNGLPGLLGQFRVSPEFVERAELIQGPAVLLNGMSLGGAVGGAVNLVAKRASAEPVTRVHTGYSSDSLWSSHWDVGRRFGTDQAWGIRVNAGGRQGDTARERLSEQVRDAALALDFQSTHLRAWLDLISQRQNMHGIGNSLNLGAVGGPVPRAPRGASNSAQHWNTLDSDDNTAMGRVEWDLSERLTLFAALGHARNSSLAVIDQAPYLDAQGNFAYYSIPTQWRQTTRSAQWGMQGQFDTGPVQHRWSLSALDTRRRSLARFGLTALNGNQGLSNIYHPVTVPPPTAAADPLGPYVWDVRVELPSYAFVDTLAFAQDRVLLTLGLRRQTVRTDTFTGYPAQGAGSVRYQQTVSSPMLGLVVKPTQQLALYANHMQGLTTGGIAPAGSANQGQSFAPYRSRQFEVGAKYDWGRWGASVSLFQITKPYSELDPASNRFGVQGEQRHRGVELQVFGNVARGVRVLGGAMLMQPRIVAAGPGHGQRPVGATRRQLNLGAEWDLPTATGWTVLARATHTGDSYADSANLARVPGWTVYDLGLRYATQWGQTPLTLRGTVENAFNQRYWKQGQYTATPGMPRSVALSASFDF